MFLLPIYSETPEKFEEWLRTKAQDELRESEEISGVEASASLKEQVLETAKEKYGSRWQFNRAVGWIHITKATGGFTFNVAVSSTKKRREPKKSFSALEIQNQPNQGKHISFNAQSNTSEIINRFERVFKEIISSNSTFKGCHVDSSAIKENAEFINWKAVLETKF